MTLCAATRQWPFRNTAATATAAQVALFTKAYLNLMPKPERKGMKAVDDMTWNEWQSMWNKDSDEANDGPA